MNETIKKLALKAYNNAGQPTPDALSLFMEVYSEKFAELIVKECIAMSYELKTQYFTSRKSAIDFNEKNIYAEGEAACDVLKYKMKKHFGVTE